MAGNIKFPASQEIYICFIASNSDQKRSKQELLVLGWHFLSEKTVCILYLSIYTHYGIGKKQLFALLKSPKIQTESLYFELICVLTAF